MIKRVPFTLLVGRLCQVSVEMPDQLIQFALIAGAKQSVVVEVSQRVALTVVIDPEEV